jgi:hypothetical protein
LLGDQIRENVSRGVTAERWNGGTVEWRGLPGQEGNHESLLKTLTRNYTRYMTHSERNKSARIAGALYLVYIAAHVFADVFGRDAIIQHEDAATTVQNLVEAGGQFRVGIVADLIASLLFFLAAWALYRLLSSVGRDLALLFLLLNLGGVAVQCASDLFLLAGQSAVTNPDMANAFDFQQVNALATFFLRLYEDAFMGAQIFYAIWLFPLGYLIYHSGFIPKIIGAVLMIHCVTWFVTFLHYFLFPTLGGFTVVSYLLGFIAEFGLGLWLLAMGARDRSAIPA